MKSLQDNIRASFTEAQTALTDFIQLETNIEAMDVISSKLAELLNGDGKVLSCGNGGSMCDAQHFAEELTGRFRKARPAMAALAISDPSHITCVANDYGFEYIFSKYIEAHGKKGDMLLALSTSGNSANVLNAVNAAKKLGMVTVGLLGKDGGELKGLVDFPLIVPATQSDRIQEVHIKIIHILIESIERRLFPKLY